ncbi:MAG: hypothetical protein NVSMB9_05050 [Isosphaeraceae bacterium]
MIAHDMVIVSRALKGELPIVGAAVRALFSSRFLGSRSWQSLGRQVGAAIRVQVETGLPAVGDVPPASIPTHEELVLRIQRVLDEQVNPVIASHGGGVEILALKDNVVYLQMWGGCQGCGLADHTLKNGVEAAIRDAVPEVVEIFDLTNHAAGQRPYHVPRARRGTT